MTRRLGSRRGPGGVDRHPHHLRHSAGRRLDRGPAEAPGAGPRPSSSCTTAAPSGRCHASLKQLLETGRGTPPRTTPIDNWASDLGSRHPCGPRSMGLTVTLIASDAPARPRCWAGRQGSSTGRCAPDPGRPLPPTPQPGTCRHWLQKSVLSPLPACCSGRRVVSGMFSEGGEVPAILGSAGPGPRPGRHASPV